MEFGCIEMETRIFQTEGTARIKAIEDTYIEQNNLPILNPVLSFWVAITVVPQTIGKMEKELKMFQIHMYNYF